MSLRSLRWQIQLWHAAVLVALVTTILVVFYGYERHERIARIDAELTGPLVALLPRHIPLPNSRRPPLPRPPAAEGRVDFEQDLEAKGHYIVAILHDGTIAYRTPDAPETRPDPDRPAPAIYGRWNGAHRELVNLTPRGDAVVIGRRDTHIASELRLFALRLGTFGAGVVALGLIGGYLIASRAMRPLRTIGDTARRIANGDWNERIAPGQAPAELEQLRTVLNDTFDRLAVAYEHQRRFTADASHELGTPVAIVLAQTQHALARPRTPDDYVAALAACRRAGERMKALTRDLLDLAAYDSPNVAIRRVECDLAEIARESLALVAPLAERREAILVDHIESVTAGVDPLGLSQVLVNLLTNALTHNAPGVRVTLSVRREGAQALLTVADNGRGIPPEVLPHVFERFYRGDQARTRDSGGSGLGLAIARRIALLHGGDLTVANAPEGGAVFTLRLPLGGVVPKAV